MKKFTLGIILFLIGLAITLIFMEVVGYMSSIPETFFGIWVFVLVCMYFENWLIFKKYKKEK